MQERVVGERQRFLGQLAGVRRLAGPERGPRSFVEPAGGLRSIRREPGCPLERSGTGGVPAACRRALGGLLEDRRDLLVDALDRCGEMPGPSIQVGVPRTAPTASA